MKPVHHGTCLWEMNKRLNSFCSSILCSLLHMSKYGGRPKIVDHKGGYILAPRPGRELLTERRKKPGAESILSPPLGAVKEENVK